MAPDPHDPPMVHAPMTRRALRAARERAERLDRVQTADVPTMPIPVVVPDRSGPQHPPIFKPPPPPLPSQRARPALLPLTTKSAHARHVRKPRVGFVARAGMAAASVLVVAGGASALAMMNAPTPTAPVAETPLTADITGSKVGPPVEQDDTSGTTARPTTSAPATMSPTRVEAASLALCDTPSFTRALKKGDDAGAIAAAGGSERFREAVADGDAPCVSLSDPTHVWVVVDKLRPLEPKNYVPAPLSKPDGVRSLDGSGLRSNAADALAALAKASRAAGAGQLGLNSGYRSYTTQIGNYDTQKAERGVDGADAVSARPGYSEHQTGLAADVEPCSDSNCATLDDVAGSSQGAWIVDNAWKYGWVVRYEKGESEVTGYSPEPWHLRYIGTDLAKAYHDGGYHTLEEFFGLPDAPDYDD